jgi:hypothetical protein
MNLERLRTILFLVVLIAVILPACAPAGDNGADAVATAVAATLAAGEKAQPSPIWTIHPTATASPPEPDIVFQGVSFSYSPGLAANINPAVLEAVSDEGGPWWSTPETVSFIFNGYALPGAFLDARIQVYDVAEFGEINSTVGERLAILRQVLDSGDVIDDRIGMADLFNAAQFLRTKVAFVDFQNGSGVRFLAQYGQAFSAVGWPHLFYGYQGLTDDGQYFVSVIMPVSHPSLPHPDTVVIDEAFAENFINYAAENELALQTLPDDSFQPSLVLLDQLVASLLVEAP